VQKQAKGALHPIRIGIVEALEGALKNAFPDLKVATASWAGMPVVKQVAPCTLHPAPCTLHPTPCTPYLTPHTPHPTPHTPHPTPPNRKTSTTVLQDLVLRFVQQKS
jgi:hypothetical protein